jgi:protein TonB
MVELITPPRPVVLPTATPQPPVELPKPKPVTKLPHVVKHEPPKQVAPAPLITAPSDAPSPVIAAPPAPAAAPAPVAAAPASASTGTAGPVAVTPPIFSADYLENPSPPYPPLSRRMREQGRVMLRVLVSPGGTADDVQIRSSSGVTRLDEAAQETVRRWKFVPAKRGSEAVSAWVLIPISFKLEG